VGKIEVLIIKIAKGTVESNYQTFRAKSDSFYNEDIVEAWLK